MGAAEAWRKVCPDFGLQSHSFTLVQYYEAKFSYCKPHITRIPATARARVATGNGSNEPIRSENTDSVRAQFK